MQLINPDLGANNLNKETKELLQGGFCIRYAVRGVGEERSSPEPTDQFLGLFRSGSRECAVPMGGIGAAFDIPLRPRCKDNVSRKAGTSMHTSSIAVHSSRWAGTEKDKM